MDEITIVLSVVLFVVVSIGLLLGGLLFLAIFSVLGPIAFLIGAIIARKLDSYEGFSV